MAIDSALKRRSAGGIPFLPLGPNVTADALKPVAWRATVGWAYAGISYSAPSTAAEILQHFVYRRRRRLRAKKLTV